MTDRKLRTVRIIPLDKKVLAQVAALDPARRSPAFFASLANWSTKGPQLLGCREVRTMKRGPHPPLLGFTFLEEIQEPCPWAAQQLVESPWLVETGGYSNKHRIGWAIGEFVFPEEQPDVGETLLNEAIGGWDSAPFPVNNGIWQYRRSRFVSRYAIRESNVLRLRWFGDRGFKATKVVKAPIWFPDEDAVVMEYRLTCTH